jgi:hypothetical protein
LKSSQRMWPPRFGRKAPDKLSMRKRRHVAVVNKKVRIEMCRIGHARVPAPHHNLDRQIAAPCTRHCRQIFREKASGRKAPGVAIQEGRQFRRRHRSEP